MFGQQSYSKELLERIRYALEKNDSQSSSARPFVLFQGDACLVGKGSEGIVLVWHVLNYCVFRKVSRNLTNRGDWPASWLYAGVPRLQATNGY
jgi:hypothetical protein